MEEEREVTTVDDGGNAVLSVGVRQFLAARIGEITSLTKQLAGTGGTQGRGKGFSFQHVNKHMRRRAVSHNIKRLPRSLRTNHEAQLRKGSGGLRKKPKKPTRKYRRRSDGDVLEYNRRQLTNPRWLESHIWHAKRFHMKAMWDRKLAIAPTAKCFRALFRGIKLSAIMQDVSYLNTLELSGPISKLTKVLNTVLKEQISLPCSGSREILAHFYSFTSGSYIGPVKYLWVSSDSVDNVKLLIWTHPLIKLDIVNELRVIFDLVAYKTKENFPEFPTLDEKKHLWKLAGNLSWYNKTNNVLLHEADGCYNRIRLHGQRVLIILKEILKVGNLSLPGLQTTDSKDQESIWNSVESISSMPNGTVVQLNVIDPRTELPARRCSAARKTTPEENHSLVTSKACQEKQTQMKLDSPLWTEEGRRLILREKTSDQLLSKRRSTNLIPGTSLNDGKALDVIPIALVFRSSVGSFAGVDLIVPCGWLMPFWIALSYRCVRSFAMEFNDYLQFEENPYLLDFSSSTRLSPDSIRYPEHTDKSASEAKAKYFSYPPAKRHNLIKLACAFPFRANWAEFIRLTTSQLDENMDTPVIVLKSAQELRPISKCIAEMNPDDLIFSQSSALVPVRAVYASGAVDKVSCFCIPSEEDLRMFNVRKHRQLHIIQTPAKDTNERRRTELNQIHLKHLARLRKKRKVARRAAHKGLNKSFDLKARLIDLDSHEAVRKYNQEMNELWLPRDTNEVLQMQDREIIGFSEYAHFSFVRGKTSSVGYVTVGGLKKLVEAHKSAGLTKGQALRVLVRNWASSLTYHWAKLEYPNQFG